MTLLICSLMYVSELAFGSRLMLLWRPPPLHGAPREASGSRMCVGEFMLPAFLTCQASHQRACLCLLTPVVIRPVMCKGLLQCWLAPRVVCMQIGFVVQIGVEKWVLAQACQVRPSQGKLLQ